MLKVILKTLPNPRQKHRRQLFGFEPVSTKLIISKLITSRAQAQAAGNYSVTSALDTFDMSFIMYYPSYYFWCVAAYFCIIFPII
jgi:hypothetical protein